MTYKNIEVHPEFQICENEILDIYLKYGIDISKGGAIDISSKCAKEIMETTMVLEQETI